MNRVLGFSITLSAGVHAAILFGLPETSLPMQGLGLGSSTAASVQRASYLPPVRVSFPVSADETRQVALPPAGPEKPAAEDAQDVSAGQGQDIVLDSQTIRLPADLDPPAPQTPLPLPAGELAIPVLPAPRRAAPPPIRIEDVIWNRKVAERIGRPFLPAALRNQGLHGTVKLLLLLTPEGGIRDLRVTDKGVSETLFLAAQAQVRASAPFPPSPEGMDPCFLRIPLIVRY